MAAPLPPLDETTPFLPQLVATVACGAGAAACIGLGIRNCVRDRSALLLLLIAGAVLASPLEAPLDIFVSAYFPHEDLWSVVGAFGRDVPVWAHFAWIVLYAGAPYLLAQAMRRGNLRDVAWKGVAGLLLTDILIELPAQATDLYFFYGDQPLRVGDFPMTMAAINAATMMAIAVAIYLWENRLAGRQRLLALIVPGLAVPASTMTSGFPVSLAVGAGLPGLVIYIGAAASLALSYLAIRGMLLLAERHGPTTAVRFPTPTRPVAVPK